jgi:hypothetical protein
MATLTSRSIVDDAVYSKFPTQSVVVLVNETINALREGKGEAVAAAAHLDHILCTLGMAFSLPLANVDVMQGKHGAGV